MEIPSRKWKSANVVEKSEKSRPTDTVVFGFTDLAERVIFISYLSSHRASQCRRQSGDRSLALRNDCTSHTAAAWLVVGPVAIEPCRTCCWQTSAPGPTAGSWPGPGLKKMKPAVLRHFCRPECVLSVNFSLPGLVGKAVKHGGRQ